MTDVRTFRLPDLGEGLTEAEVVAWHVAPGDTVELNQVLLEVETEKAVVELPSPFAGTVVELSPTPATRSRSAHRSFPSRPPTPRSPPTPNPLRLRRRSRCSSATGPRNRRRAGAAAAAADAPATTVRSTLRPRRRSRNRARPRPHPRSVRSPHPRSGSSRGRQGVDLADVTGHGPGGIVTREDLAATIGRRPDATRDRTRDGTPVKGVQKHMADAMVRSVTTAPQACVFLTVDVTPTRTSSSACGRTAASMV